MLKGGRRRRLLLLLINEEEFPRPTATEPEKERVRKIFVKKNEQH